MIWQKKKPLSQEEVQLHHARLHPAWDGIRADLDVPRPSDPAALREAHEDFRAGIDAEVLAAEHAFDGAVRAFRNAVIAYLAFDEAQLAESENGLGAHGPSLARAIRRMRHELND